MYLIFAAGAVMFCSLRLPAINATENAGKKMNTTMKANMPYPSPQGLSVVKVTANYHKSP